MLRLENVCASYGEGAVLHGVNLEVAQGEIVALIGSNGAGKTTTLKTITGLLRPTSGSITLDGDSIGGQPVDRIVRRGLSLVPEGRRVFAKMTVRENLEVGAYLRGADRSISEDIDRIFSLFPVLCERAKQPASVLSGGEQQMLAMGRALMSNPRVLLLDEPSMGLAPIVVDQIFQLIREIHDKGTAILLVEQNAALALEACHRGYVMENGKISLSGTGSDLLKDQGVQSAFLGRSGIGARARGD
ncbi:MAG: ABC transporter ATP-binding protein [Firmicutes bacterium]|nr:ABC transporter ATP-binding protein [Bacillota bacterium]